MLRTKWRTRGHPKHKSGGYSEVVIVKLKNGDITSDRYKSGFRGNGWEKYTSVVGWFYLPKGGKYTNQSVWQRFINS